MNNNKPLSVLFIGFLIALSIITLLVNEGFYYASFNDQLAIRTNGVEQFEAAQDIANVIDDNPTTLTVFFDQKDQDSVTEFIQNNEGAQQYIVTPNTNVDEVYITAIVIPLVILIGIVTNFMVSLRKNNEWRYTLMYFGTVFISVNLIVPIITAGVVSVLSRFLIVQDIDIVTFYTLLFGIVFVLSTNTSEFVYGSDIKKLYEQYIIKTKVVFLRIVPAMGVLAIGLIFAGGIGLVISGLMLIVVTGIAIIALQATREALALFENQSKKNTKPVAKIKDNKKESKTKSNAKKSSKKSNKTSYKKKKKK